MARLNTLRWSGRSQGLLAQAVADPTFLATMRVEGIGESQLRLWISLMDVPITMRGQMRGCLEDWAHANPHRDIGVRL